MSKILRAALALILCLCMCFMLCSCKKKADKLDVEEISQICVKGALYESWMCNFTDDEFISEMVKMYNGIRYEKSEEAVNMMDAEKVYSLTFYNDDETVATFIVDVNKNCSFEAGGESYHIVSDFDFEELSKMINDQKTELKSSIATPDQK
ncbi:MAG: hypothetical protein IKB73_03265 [Ruminococcus sp.]|nr:hypothetical protein [Ruminococcus sp.]